MRGRAVKETPLRGSGTEPPRRGLIIPPSVSDEQAKAKFPMGWRAPKPYLRYVPQPRSAYGLSRSQRGAVSPI